MLTKTALSSVPSLTHIRTSAKRYIRDKSRRGRRIEICKAHRRRKQILIATRKGMCISFNENDARCIGRTARGVKAITLSEGDEIAGMCVPEENKRYSPFPKPASADAPNLTITVFSRAAARVLSTITPRLTVMLRRLPWSARTRT